MASSHTRNKAARHATRVVTAALVCLVACATRDRAAPTNPSPPPLASAPAEQQADARDDARDGGVGRARSISSPCVLHAGEGKRKTRKVRLPSGASLQEEQHGSCSANAECIATHGQETPGDGFVSLACAERTCTCTLETLPSPRTKPSTSSFEIASPCATAEQAMQLMVEHCMTGMTVLHR